MFGILWGLATVGAYTVVKGIQNKNESKKNN